MFNNPRSSKQKAYRYGNELDAPLDWRLNSFLHSIGNGANGEPDWGLRFELVRRFELLFAHWGISKDAPDAYQQLAVNLAFNHVVGLSIVPPDKRRRGNPGKDWRFLIFGAVEDALRKQDQRNPAASKRTVHMICTTLSRDVKPFKGVKVATLERAYKKEKKRRNDFEKARIRMQELMAPKSTENPLAKALNGGVWGSWG